MILWIFNHYACFRHGSGLTSHAVMAQTLAESGHEVTIFPAAFAQAFAPAVEIDGGKAFVDSFDGDVRFRFVRTRPYHNTAGRLFNMLSYRNNIRHCTVGLRRPDVIIGSLAHPYAVEAARLTARRLGSLFIYEIRDIWPQSLVEMGGISRLHPIYWHFRSLERRAFRHADAVISVLPGISEYAEQNGVAPQRTAYIPNGIEPQLFPEPPTPPPFDRAKTNVTPAEPFVISCFTRFGSGNALDTIIEAAKILKENPRGSGIIIRLVGDGPTRNGLRRRAAELALTNVEFLDLVSKPRLVELAHDSHAFVHSHRAMRVIEHYGMSVNKVFGFMASGRPVIFACRSCYDPIREAAAGISIAPENPQAMAAAMVELRDIPSVERQAMGRQGRDYVFEHHNLGKTAKRLEAFLGSLLGQN